MTRGGNRYDTCCKACSKHLGKLTPDQHDENCGGAAGVASALYDGPNPKTHLMELVKPGSSILRQAADSIFERLPKMEGGATALSAWSAIEDGLLAMIQHKFAVRDSERDSLTMKIKHSHTAGFRNPQGLASTATLNADEFRELCREVASAQYYEWFPPSLKVMTRSFVRRNLLPYDRVYREGRKLGSGSFGEVFDVTHIVSNESRVCKKIMKSRGKEGMRADEIMAEINNMALLDHPGVIKVYEHFEDARTIIQIMEPCRGGELQAKIEAVFVKKSEQRYPEVFMCDVMKQVLRALAFMHDKKFIHKDLKPQNIMLVEEMCSGESKASIKVIDFGLAELFGKGQEKASEVGGTLLYMAPEVFKNQMRFKCDIWSAGVVLYHMLTGTYPFMGTWPPPPGRDEAWWSGETRRLIETDSIPMTNHAFLKHASAECMQAMTAMLQKNQNYRPDAGETLALSWFERYAEPPAALSVGITQCLEAYAQQPDLKKAFFLLMAHSHSSSAPALGELRAIFTHFDRNNTGSLHVDTLRVVLLKSRLAPVTVERVLYALDRDTTGMVQWTEFTAAALCIANSKKKNMIQAAFNTCDTDGDGWISHEDLVAAFAAVQDRDAWRRDIAKQCQQVFKSSASKFNLEQVTEAMMEHMSCSMGDKLGVVS